MSSLRSELRDNDQKETSFRPSPQELESIERLQRSGVTGVDLLDRMVEQGDEWLNVTMRRLDHFERTGLAPKDYSTWCEHALSGAYDWIDHDRLGGSSGSASGASGVTGATRTVNPGRTVAPAAPSPSQATAPTATQANVPEWLGRNAPRHNAPAGGGGKPTPPRAGPRGPGKPPPPTAGA